MNWQAMARKRIKDQTRRANGAIARAALERGARLEAEASLDSVLRTNERVMNEMGKLLERVSKLLDKNSAG